MFKSTLWVLSGVVVGAVLMIGVMQFFKPSENKAVVSETVSPIPTPTFYFDPEKPPKDSLVGNILTLNGEVKWKGRVATESAVIKEVQKIQQGEELETGKNSKVVVEFPKVIKLSILPESKLEFGQTLPINLVFVQKLGAVEYQNMSQNDISIKAKRLLIDQEQPGDFLVAMDEEEDEITLNVRKGLTKVAYNNDDLVTQVVEVKEGERFIFDNENRDGQILNPKR